MDAHPQVITKRLADGELVDDRPSKKSVTMEQEYEYPRPSADTPVTYGSVRKYVRNPSYNKYIAQAVKGRKRRAYGYYRPRYYYGGRGYRSYGRPYTRRRRYRGYGAYSMDSGADFGTRWGGYLGSKLGEYVGGATQGLVKRITGFGDYKIKANALMPNEAGEIVNPNTHGGTVYRGTEYVGDIISGSAGTFNSQKFIINPALETTFPKLAQFLANYDQYVIEGMYFEYRTMSCDALNSTNTALGQVVMACNYNVLNPDFGSKQEMEEYDGGVSIKPSESCKFFIECARSESPMDVLYTRAGALPESADQRMYDLGNFQIATNGMQASNVNVGELWVTYQVAGLKPKLFSGLGNYNSGFAYQNTAYNANDTLGDPAGTITVTYQSPAGIEQGWGIVTDVVTGFNTLEFPVSPLKQTYVVVIYWEGTAATYTPCTVTATNCSIVSGDALNAWGAPFNGALSTTQVGRKITILADANEIPSIKVSGGSLPTSGVIVQINAYQIPNAVIA